jgi:hypothetical protein
MSTFFHARHYPTPLVTNALRLTDTKSRMELLSSTKPIDPPTRIPLVLTYHPSNIPPKNIFYKNYHILQDDPDLGKLFPQLPLLAYRRDHNIKDTLVSSIVKDDSDIIPGTFTCNRNRCITCHHVCQNVTIKGPKHNFIIRDHFTCVTPGVIYCIHCLVCHELYIGETSRRLADRFREHVYNVKKKLYKTGEVSKHFNKSGHSFTDMEVSGMLQITDITRRKKMEESLIYKLGTLDPCGLNELCNLDR